MLKMKCKLRSKKWRKEMLNKWTRCNILNEEPYMGSSLLQCRRWQGQQMQIVESSIHGSQTFWCLLTTLVFKLDPDWCYCHGPQEWCQKLAKFSSSSAERKQKSGGSQILTLAQTGDNFQALLVLCFHVQLTVWYRAWEDADKETEEGRYCKH